MMASLRGGVRVSLLSRSLGWKTAMLSREVTSVCILGARSPTSSFIEFVLDERLNCLWTLRLKAATLPKLLISLSLNLFQSV